MSHNSASSQKPEYVLKRANDLINTGGKNAEKEKRWALELLHNAIGSKRKLAQWNKVFEQLMKRHLELCIDLKDHHVAKDGLHQYRNLCQQMDPNSLEVVITHLIDLAEARATSAREKADKVALAAAAKVADLEEDETPESIMLSSMTEEGSKDRTDREVVVPWLKFLWEIYRAVLELLHRNRLLEKVYHTTCEKAAQFCKDFNRNGEFRKLCQMLRTHVANMTAPAAVAPRANRPAFEWTPEVIDLHLKTRFNQLEVASHLELWNEGFRTVEDIYNIMQLGKKTHRPKLMAVYYEKLTRIFWVSGNHLFHAYAWFRYYVLACESRKDLKQDDKCLLASSVLLSALTIPSLKDFDSTLAVVDDDETATQKNQKVATLLDFQANPTRKNLLADIVAKGILADVIPEVAALYHQLETNFQPLTLVKSVLPSVAVIKAHPQLLAYVVPLERVVVLRVMQQLSKVYSVIKLDFVRQLLAGLDDISYNTVEKIMIDGVSRKQLHLKIDHSAGCVRFGTVGAAAVVENQVAQLGENLSKAVATVTKLEGGSTLLDAQAAQRRQFMLKVAAIDEEEQDALVKRRNEIERRKESIEKRIATIAEYEALAKEEQERLRKIAEELRQQEEARQREEEKQKKMRELMDVKKYKQDLEKYDVFMDETALAQLTTAGRAEILSKAKSEKFKAKEDESKRANEQAKRLDHITRALRIEAVEIIRNRVEEQRARDIATHEKKVNDLMEERLAEHTRGLEIKHSLERMQSHRSAFEGNILLREQRRMYEASVARLREKAIKEYRERKLAGARRRMNEERERLAEEEEEAERRRELDAHAERLRKVKEEEDRIKLEEYERLRQKREEEEALEREREAEKRAKQLEEEKIKALKTKELEELRKQKLEEAKRKSAGAAAPVPSPSVAPAPAPEQSWSRGKGPAVPPAASADAGKEKEIKWRSAPAPTPAQPVPAAAAVAAAEVPEVAAPVAAPAAAPVSDEGEWKMAPSTSRPSQPKRNLDDWGKSGPSAGGPPRRSDSMRDTGRPSDRDRDGGRGGDRDRDGGRPSDRDRDGGRGGDRDSGRSDPAPASRFAGLGGSGPSGGRDRDFGGGGRDRDAPPRGEGGGRWGSDSDRRGGAGGGRDREEPRRTNSGFGGPPRSDKDDGGSSWRRK